MKKMNETTMRQANGGRWKCNDCHKIYNAWIGLWTNNHVGKCGIKFGYHWVF